MDNPETRAILGTRHRTKKKDEQHKPIKSPEINTCVRER